MSTRAWLLALLLLPSIAGATSPNEVRDRVTAACACDHGWRSCVRREVRAALAVERMPAATRRALVGCLTRSVCGRAPGTVVCCGAGGCGVERSAVRCAKRRGRVACPGARTCCDACAGGVCVPTTAPTRPTTSTSSTSTSTSSTSTSTSSPTSLPPREVDLAGGWILEGAESDDGCGEATSAFNSWLTISRDDTRLRFHADVSSDGSVTWTSPTEFRASSDLPFGAVNGPGARHDCPYDLWVDVVGTVDAVSGEIAARQHRYYFPLFPTPECSGCAVTWTGTMRPEP